ncbi:hypothetical protein GJ496_002083 [Pomphorhynchus laevis]|nr:hypothetical protein GJ496_002083 [Pomphorhynchus laevis]
MPRFKYTFEQDIELINLVYQELIAGIRGKLIFQRIASSSRLPFNFESLRARFCRVILPRLDEYRPSVSKAIRKQFIAYPPFYRQISITSTITATDSGEDEDSLIQELTKNAVADAELKVEKIEPTWLNTQCNFFGIKKEVQGEYVEARTKWNLKQVEMDCLQSRKSIVEDISHKCHQYFQLMEESNCAQLDNDFDVEIFQHLKSRLS